MGKVIMSGIVPQLTVPSAGTPISEFAVGSTVKMNVNGTQKDFLIVHQGLPSSLYSSSCNGTWLVMNEIYEKRLWYELSSNLYMNSDIHQYLNSTFLGLFDSNIQSVIKQVKIPHANKTGTFSVASGENGLETKIFLLSGYEVGWTQSNHQYFTVDGVKLDYFESGGTTSAANKRISIFNGSAAQWWLRSPYVGNSSSVWDVESSGGYGTAEPHTEFGIRPALILPSTALVKNDGTIKGAA